jgi:hypothetical protein
MVLRQNTREFCFKSIVNYELRITEKMNFYDAPNPTEGAKVMGSCCPIFRAVDWDLAHRLGRNRRVQAAFFQG